jgi:hypothetical protein
LAWVLLPYASEGMVLTLQLTLNKYSVSSFVKRRVT